MFSFVFPESCARTAGLTESRRRAWRLASVPSWPGSQRPCGASQMLQNGRVLLSSFFLPPSSVFQHDQTGPRAFQTGASLKHRASGIRPPASSCQLPAASCLLPATSSLCTPHLLSIPFIVSHSSPPPGCIFLSPSHSSAHLTTTPGRSLAPHIS